VLVLTLIFQTLLAAKRRGSNVAVMTKAILFLGVPHEGTSASIVACLLSCAAYGRGSGGLLQYLSERSFAIHRLNSDFHDGFVNPNLHPQHKQPYISDLRESRPKGIGHFVLGQVRTLVEVRPN
jgi:hypothetical protein